MQAIFLKKWKKEAISAGAELTKSLGDEKIEFMKSELSSRGILPLTDWIDNI